MWQNHNLIFPSYRNTTACRYPLISIGLTDSPSWVSMIPKLDKLNLKQRVPHLLYKNLYLPKINCHIFLKFLVYPTKFDNFLLVVTFFYFLFFNYTSVFVKRICLLVIVKMKKALKDLATVHFTKNMMWVRNMQILIFFLQNLCFYIKAYFHHKSRNNVEHLVWFPLLVVWSFICFSRWNKNIC